MTSDISLLQPKGYQRNKSCGYCKTTNGSSSFYMTCDSMRLEHYQELMDRGWRRSGTMYYKQDLTRACCPYYTIRLKASDFKANKDQRKPINRLNQYLLGPEYKRKAAMLCPQTREEKLRCRDKFDLTSEVHKAEYDTVRKPVGKKSGQPVEPAHKFEINLEGDNFTEEKYGIFLKYQVQIHKDPVSRWGESAFKRFLCSGLNRKILKLNGRTMKLGSYHQCYRIDGKLVAVGVLDLLPHAVSSVYLFYDPEYQDWDWGKVSALHEISLALEAKYEYYYMGYYIHSCIKMRYKAAFSPTLILDPENLEWNVLDDAYRNQLDHRKYLSPSRDRANGEAGNSDSGGPSLSEPTSQMPTESEKPPDTTKSRGQTFSDDQDLELDEADSDEDDAEIPEGSLFEYNIPGALKKEEVAKLDLDHWRLVVRDSLIELEDLRGWEESTIDDPYSIKGIAAETIAVTGPGLLKNSALVLF